MKYRKYIILALVLVSGLFSCQRDEDIAIAILNINSEVIEPSYTSADVECYVECNTKFDNVVVEYASSEDFADAQSATMSEKEGKYHAKCVNLLDDTTYYIRYVVSNRLSSMTYKEISSFRTLTPSIPVVHLDSISNIWDVKADAFAHVEFDGGSPLSEWGITIWTDETTDTLRIKTESQEQCLIPIQDLQPNRIYNARAYAINKVGVAYSKEMSFITLTLPKIQTGAITDIQLTTALLNGTLVFNGNDTTTIKGFCWGQEQEPTIDDPHIQIDTASNTFFYHLSNLKDETQCQVRAYAINKIGISYGDVVSFTTKAAIPPTVTSSSVTNMTYTSATIGGNVTSDGGAAVTERGVVYSTNQNPTTASSKVTSGNGIGSFTCNITNLQENTKYYVRAYAINKKGTSYDEQISFTTKALNLPSVTTSYPTNISYTSATVDGEVISDGGASVTERGVVYSTSQAPNILNSKVTGGSGTGSFTCNLTNLQENTKYYVCAYATNRKGTSYGPQASFTTKASALPTVTTSSATNIIYTSATIGGNVTADGGATVTERGVVYGTSQNPTTSNSKVQSGSGTGAFTCSLTNLQEGTTYYVRAYATNKKGTSYGSQSSFTTKAYALPTLTTSSATNISYTSATIGGNVTNDGGTSVTERGVVYSTNQNPTTSDSKVTGGSGTGSFSVNLTNLAKGTTYYVRAYAINEKGTAYGAQKSFTTSAVAMPTVTTSSATNISKTSAIMGGNVTSDGGASVTERGVVYSTSSNPTTSNSKVTSGSGMGSFTCNITNLQEGTTYYVRAYATNEKGTAYGNQVVFTTLEAPIENGHEYVDLGLSVKWATCNVGASRPEDYGDYFAWGETQPKSTYTWSTYKWCNGSNTTLTKYNTSSSYGTVDNKTQLELSDDAARANWGGSWRMPTRAEQDELRNNCTWTWTTQNGVNGYKVTSKSNGKSIFLPAAGYLSVSSLHVAGSFGYYWSSSLYTGYPDDAYNGYFHSSNVDWVSSSRCYGRSVRPVCP